MGNLDTMKENGDHEEDKADKNKTNEDGKEMVSLVAWMRSFPRWKELSEDVENVEDEAGCMEWMDHDQIACATLEIAKEIYGGTDGHSCNEDNSQSVWQTIFEITQTDPSSSIDIDRIESPLNQRKVLLSNLLCRAVSDLCPLKNNNVHRIMTLPYHTQRTLMIIIKQNIEGMAPKSPTTPPFSPLPTPPPTSNKKKRLATGSPTMHFFTPKQYKTHAQNPLHEHHQQSPANLLSPNYLCSSYSQFSSPHLSCEQSAHQQKQLEIIQNQNTELTNKLSKSLSNEKQLFVQLQDTQTKHRSELLHIETKSLHEMSDLRSKYSTEIAALQRQIQDLKYHEQENKKYKEEMSRMQDKIELLQQSQRKLSATEEQYQKCKRKLHTMSDIEQHLKREEEAHARCIEQCFAYEKELHSFRQMKQHMEEYKTRCIDAESKLDDAEHELRKYEQQAVQQREEIRELKETKNEMRQDIDNKMEEEAVQKEAICESIRNDRIQIDWELSKKIMQMQDQLDNYVHSVKTMEDLLNDTQSLSTNYKEKLLSTKLALDHTQQTLENTLTELHLSKCEEETSQNKLHQESEQKEMYLKKYIDAKERLGQVEQLLENSIHKENQSKMDVQAWMRRYDHLEQAMKKERQSHQKPILDAEQTYQMSKQLTMDAPRLGTQQPEQMHSKDMEEKTLVRKTHLEESAQSLKTSLEELLEAVKQQGQRVLFPSIS